MRIILRAFLPIEKGAVEDLIENEEKRTKQTVSEIVKRIHVAMKT